MSKQQYSIISNCKTCRKFIVYNMRETCNQCDKTDCNRTNKIEIENYKVSQY